MSNDELLSPEEMAAVQESIEAIAAGLIEYGHPGTLIDTLRGFWGYDDLPVHLVREAPAQYPSRTPDWYIGMSPEFRKATQHIDRKLQGRIFEAISHISGEPTTSRGDTVKPLASDLKGLWRYRIGDFRLVYYPDDDKRLITLITFAGRGSVYG